jgi:hypothetical protein
MGVEYDLISDATREGYEHHTFGYEEKNWLVGEWLCRFCHSTSEPKTEHV